MKGLYKLFVILVFFQYQQRVVAFTSDEKGVFRSDLPGVGQYTARITSIGKEMLTKDFELIEGERMRNSCQSFLEG